jgi:hypothetical protein
MPSYLGIIVDMGFNHLVAIIANHLAESVLIEESALAIPAQYFLNLSVLRLSAYIECAIGEFNNDWVEKLFSLIIIVMILLLFLILACWLVLKELIIIVKTLPLLNLLPSLLLLLPSLQKISLSPDSLCEMNLKFLLGVQIGLLRSTLSLHSPSILCHCGNCNYNMDLVD